ncbi:MAG TPA: site-2 protease family protein [Gemmataceae bacterium]|nr:site-2 protease family protein [Gemmataceae bacterium]
MSTAPPASDLERRKQVKLRIRADLAIEPQRYEGRTFYVVKDPVSLRYYRFKEHERFLIRMMDGTHTLDEAQKEFEKKFRPQRLPLEELESFAQQLLTAGLAHNEFPQSGKQLFDRRKKRRRREWLAALTNILYIKIPIYDPDKLLNRMLNQGLFPTFLKLPIQIMFWGWLLFCLLAPPLAGAALVADHFGLFHGRVHTFLEFVGFTRLFWIMVYVLVALKVLHLLSRDMKFIFTRWFLALSVGVMLWAILLVLMHFNTFWDRLPDYHAFFAFKMVFYLWIALGVVKVIHEFGHGLSCKAFGGEVHEMGALFLCLSPCLYCNVSDAWSMPSKWRRIIISFAGIYVELIIAAIATFVWWYSPAGTFTNEMSLSLMVVCSVSTVVFNANPLMRFDGYYILADWLEIPNLRDQSNRYLKNLFLEHGLGVEVQPEPYMFLWRRVLFVTYAITSFLYRWFVTFRILGFLYEFLGPKLKTVSALMVIAAVASLVGWPAYRMGKAYHRRGRLPDMNSKRVTITSAVFATVVLLFLFVPLPVSWVREIGLVQAQPDAIQNVWVPHPPAILERLHVRDGELVQEGQILAEFRSLDVEKELAEARAHLQGRDAEIKTLRDQAAQGVAAARRAEIERERAMAEGERAIFLTQVNVADTKKKQLVLRAPQAGIIMSPPHRDEVGKHWEKEQSKPFCSIGDPKRLQVTMPIGPADYRLLKDDNAYALPVTIRVQGRDTDTWTGRIIDLPQSEAKEVPLALTTKGGGPLAIKTGTQNNVYVPQSQHYLVRIEIDDPDAAVCPGTLAKVKIHCRPRSCGWLTWRWIASTFELGLW